MCQTKLDRVYLRKNDIKLSKKRSRVCQLRISKVYVRLKETYDMSDKKGPSVKCIQAAGN